MNYVTYSYPDFIQVQTSWLTVAEELLEVVEVEAVGVAEVPDDAFVKFYK